MEFSSGLQGVRFNLHEQIGVHQGTYLPGCTYNIVTRGTGGSRWITQTSSQDDVANGLRVEIGRLSIVARHVRRRAFAALLAEEQYTNQMHTAPL